MMGHKVSFEDALYFTKLSVYLSCTWPPPTTATKWEIIKHDIAWCTFFISALCLCIPLLLTIFGHESDLLIITQSACYVGATINIMLKMIVYRRHLKRTQNSYMNLCNMLKRLLLFPIKKIVIYEMEQVCKNALPHEKIILQRYLDRCSKFHGTITIVNYIATALIIVEALVSSKQQFPTYASYPFSVDTGVIFYLVFLHQTLVGFQCSSAITIDCQAALMLWFAAARLEILAEDLRNITDIREFGLFVQKHRKLLSYADEVSDTMAYISFTSTTANGVAAIMSSLQLFGNQPLSVKLQFAPVAVLTSVNLFICAWPADNLLNVCDLLGNAVYNTAWTDMSVNMMKNFLMVLRRCQKPVIVSVGGFLPTLSLRSYASFLSAAFSYLTTLRLVVSGDEET